MRVTCDGPRSPLQASLHRAMADMQKEKEETETKMEKAEKAKQETVRAREEVERRRVSQENDILRLQQHLEVVMEEKDRWEKEVEVVTQQSQDNLLKIEVRRVSEHMCCKY